MDRPATAMPGRLGPAEPSRADLRLLAVIALLVYAGFTCFYGLRGGPPLGDHECINAYAARNALQHGQWLIPSTGDAPLIRKMPLGAWAISAISAVTGERTELGPVTPFSARLPSAVAAFATVGLTCWLGTMLYCFRAGVVAGFIAAGGLGTLVFARNAQVDMLLTLFTTASLALFWRGAAGPYPARWAIRLFYVAFALAMLAKAPLPLATVGLSLAVYWFVTIPWAVSFERQVTSSSLTRRVYDQLRLQVLGLRAMWLLPGVLVFLILVGAWPLYVYMKVDHALPLWRIEYLSRYTGELSSRRVWYYLPLIFGLTIPYMLSIPEAMSAPFLTRYADKRRGLLYVLTVTAVGVVFLSSAAFKRPHYLLSLYPMFCLLLAPVIERLFFGVLSASPRTIAVTCSALVLVLLLGGAGGGLIVARQYPSLLPAYLAGAGAAVFCWVAACWAFAGQRRLSSFALLSLGAPLSLLFVWPALTWAVGLNAEADALAREVRQRNIAIDAPLYWAEGQASYVLPYYHGIRVHRVISEIDMASLREGRSVVSEDVYMETVRRITEHMQTTPTAHFTASAKYFDLLSRRTDVRVKEVFRLHGFHDEAEDEFVVFTKAPSDAGGSGAAGDGGGERIDEVGHDLLRRQVVGDGEEAAEGLGG